MNLNWLTTRQFRVALMLSALSLFALLALLGILPHGLFAAGAFGFAPLMLGDTTTPGAQAVPGTDTQTGGASSATTLPWRRIREKSPITFQNVAAGATAYAEIPRYALTLLRITLTLGGTTFTKAQITTLRVRLGSHVLWQVTGSDLDKMQSYLLGNLLSYIGILNPTRASMLTIDFTDPRNRHLAGEMIGGIDMTRLPSGKLRVEVTIASGASAPTLDANITWGPPQGNGLIKKYLQFPFLAGVANRNSIPLNVGGAMIQRLYFLYSGGVDWCTPATAPLAVAASNIVGNGTFGTITVNAGCQIGVHRVVMLAATLGLHYSPDGTFDPVHITTGVAYNGQGLAFTLTAGGTAFTAGDAFTITVSDVSDGNVNRVEVKKNGRTVWDMTCHEARFLEQEYGQAPQSRLYVADFQADNNSEGILRTQDAASLEYNAYVTTANDQMTIYAEVLDDPMNN